jgi:hypothetical protein
VTDELEDWPVLPDGVEGVLLRRLPPDVEYPLEHCFVCGEPMPEPGSAMCWGVPGRGVAHDGCYEPAEDDAQ